jgi:TatD DNase family protein
VSLPERGWVDAHTHLDLPAFDGDRAEVMQRAADAGVTGVVMCAADPGDWDRLITVAEALGAPWTLGVHPWWEPTLDPPAWERWHAALEARPTPHGLGETGLDRPRAPTAAARERQVRSLRRHLRLARARAVPIVLHCVRAYGALLDTIAEEGLSEAGGIVHSWSGSPELVSRAVDLGLHLSFSASALRSPRIAESLRRTPADRLLVETDCPDQPLVAGARGEPGDLVAIANRLGDLRETSGEALLSASREALWRLFPALVPAPPPRRSK